MELVGTFAILSVTVLLFVSNLLRADLVAILTMLAFLLTGILTPAEALSGFSNSVVIMMAGLFIVGAGILRTGLAKMAGNILLSSSGSNEKKLFILLLTIVASVGAFMSNTGVVALMLPIVISVAVSINTSPSKFLIPLSYTASLSGLLTLIASPPNLIVSQTLVDHGYEKLGFFEITPIGIIGILTGIVYLFFTRNALLPNHKKRNQTQDGQQLSFKQLMTDYKLGENLFHVRVPEHSEMVGKKLGQLKIPYTYQICVLKIIRKSQEGIRLLPITFQEMAGPKSIIDANDLLYLQGSPENVEKFVSDFSLLMEDSNSIETNLVSKQLGLAEVLLTPHSSFLNQTIQGIGFREKYNLNIIGINRQGKFLLKEMASKSLRFGDALLVQGAWDDIELLSKETNDVVVVGQPKEHARIAAANGKAPIAAGIMILMVLLMVFEVFPTVVSVLIGAVLMILTGCLRNIQDAYNTVNWESIILIACMLPVATALEKSGGMVLLSESIIHVLGDFGPLGVLAGLFLLTTVLGQFISNTATAVLFAPIAMNAAISMDANPYTFLIGIACASSMSFSTPVASPTNSLVMTAGNYKFFDFVKIGVPLQILMFLVMMIVIPLLFPL